MKPLYLASGSPPRLGLAARQALDIGRRGFVVLGSFVDVRADGGKGHADLREQFTPTRRCLLYTSPSPRD